MAVVIFAATVLFVIEIGSIIQLRIEAKEEELIWEERLIKETEPYVMIISDYDTIENSLNRYADDVALA